MHVLCQFESQCSFERTRRTKFEHAFVDLWPVLHVFDVLLIEDWRLQLVTILYHQLLYKIHMHFHNFSMTKIPDSSKDFELSPISVDTL
jgi:glycogen synthase